MDRKATVPSLPGAMGTTLKKKIENEHEANIFNKLRFDVIPIKLPKNA